MTTSPPDAQRSVPSNVFPSRTELQSKGLLLLRQEPTTVLNVPDYPSLPKFQLNRLLSSVPGLHPYSNDGFPCRPSFDESHEQAERVINPCFSSFRVGVGLRDVVPS